MPVPARGGAPSGPGGPAGNETGRGAAPARTAGRLTVPPQRRSGAGSQATPEADLPAGTVTTGTSTAGSPTAGTGSTGTATSGAAADPQLLSALVDRASDAIVAVDRDQRITVVNRAALEMFGWQAGEILEQPLTLLLPEHARADHAGHVDRFAEGEELWLQLADQRARLMACRRDGSTFPAEIAVSKVDVNGTWHFCAVIRDATAQQKLESTLTRMSLFDPLTGAANRTQLDERLTRLIGKTGPGQAVTVVFVDVDGFKRINDALGHLSGDEVLQEVARRLRQACRAHDLVARFGGDGFVVAGPTGDDATSALALATRLHQAFTEPFLVAGRTISVTASLGVVIVRSPRTSTEDALRDADIAVHRAKSQGRDRVVLFDPSEDGWAAVRLELEGGLHQALSDGQLFIAHQPMIDLRSGLITGVEALARWRQGDRYVPPCEFIAVAEDTGLIVPLGQYVLREACRDAVAFTRAAGRDIGVSVNLSLRQIADPHLLDNIHAALADSGLPAQRLTLEITESTLLQDERGAVPVLDAIRDAGIHLSLDDFGTGYSSLRHLKRIPVSQLKIDRSFMVGVTDPGSDDHTIVSGVLVMAHALNLSVTAEGIETAEQHAAICRLGADHGQGYYYGPPHPADLILSRLAPAG
jgi:diguanylate cyclase (GGDEF)-like protein/PAS domain S-box-containing protein